MVNGMIGKKVTSYKNVETIGLPLKMLKILKMILVVMRILTTTMGKNLRKRMQK